MTKVPDHDRPVPSETDFEVRDVVLAFHNNLLYEATILQVESVPPHRPHAYLVHFQGWTKSWDERVSSDMVFEHNEDNLRIAHRLLDGANRMRQQAAQPAENERDNKPPPEKPNNNTPSTPELFQLPPALQRQLVDEWDTVTRESRLVRLPRTPTVQDVLHKWVASRRQSADKATREVAEGLQIYFDASLPMILLYRFERLQYRTQVENSDRPPSAMYGPEHLLRLLLKLPFILEDGPIEKEKLQVIAEKANELGKYLQKHGKALFLSEYDPAPAAYVQAATKA
ncbi:Protein MRG2 [Gracilariopsis chorda]|uniref:Protein MRG2 n=1 Tax=Gracilariopsis chorda TaxID=448386 RepID=A0A2V3IS34_9FLOR|nr:Protein MRG2 [Gracilariopsis chorda]|eukprot:PXF44926.1 Protein MRG2 [Gracilariopsis chorda]